MLVMAGWVKTIVIKFGIGEGRRRSHVVNRLVKYKRINHYIFVTTYIFSYLLFDCFFDVIYDIYKLSSFDI